MEPDLPESKENVTATIGQILRRSRESNAISLEKAAEATKISKNYLKALEEDRYEEFASTAYFRGFLKNYSVYLGLDPLEISKKADSAEVTVDAIKETTPEKRLEKRRRIWQHLLLPAVLLGAIIVTSLFYSPGGGPYIKTISPVPPPAEKPVMKPISTAAVLQPLKPVPDAKSVVQTPQPEKPQAKPQPLAEGLLVRMKVLKNGSMTVAIDETSPQPYELSSGDVIEWQAGRVIAMDLSDAAGVELLMNGKHLKLPGQPGKPLSVIIDSSGIRN